MAYFKCKGMNDPIFGDGSLGDVRITADTNASSLVSYTQDTDVIELNCKTLVIDSGKTLTADKRNAGMIIRVRGDCTINGNIYNNKAPKTLSTEQQALVEAKYPSWMVSNNGAGRGGSPSGSGMNGRIYGGGYGGGGRGGNAGVDATNYGANGVTAQNITTSVADANMFKGGAGGIWYGTSIPEHPNGYSGSHGGGGGGGTAYARGGAGGTGAGANGGNGQNGSSVWGSGGGGGTGNIGGGVVIVICKGNLIVNGNINCDGNNGGKGGTGVHSGQYYWHQDGGSGGNGGGGRIFLLYKGTYTNTGHYYVRSGNGSQGTAGTGGDKKHTSYYNYKSGVEPTNITA